jgi:Tfp pilus assembly protein PilF
MHYAWGREHQAANRADEARSEYNRALTLDPGFSEADKALAELASKKRGVFSRLFRK